MAKKPKLKSFIVSHSIDTTVVVDAKDEDDAMDGIDEHAHYRVCDVSDNS